MFRGASSLNMDQKGRFAVPAKYRQVLTERCEGQFVLTVNNTGERCLWLYPQDEWEQVERKVVELPSFDPSAQALKRLLIGYATDCDLSSGGRIRVSAKFEIWDEGLWKVKCDEWLLKQPEDRPLPIELESLSL